VACRPLDRRLSRREEGQGMVEYALILVLIAVVVLLILTTLGKQVNKVFSNISSTIGT
jgi:pilus assembly protein Flp/PilA